MSLTDVEILFWGEEDLQSKYVIHLFIPFHTWFSSRERLGGRTPRRMSNTSRFSAVSGSSFGSSLIRDQVMQEM